MKVRISLQIFIALLCAIFPGCRSTEDKKASKYNMIPKPFETNEFKITEILKPIDMCLNENYICLLHDEESGGEQIFVYDAENLNYLYKFAKRGPGPEETLALDFVKNQRGDSIDLID